jgi:hypothetical protein
MALLLANDSIWAINHASGLGLNKKANYLANQVKICNCATRVRCASRYRFILCKNFIGKLTVNFRKLIKLLRPYFCGGREKVGKSNNFKNELTMFTP